jgi:hypothetical protein
MARSCIMCLYSKLEKELAHLDKTNAGDYMYCVNRKAPKDQQGRIPSWGRSSGQCEHFKCADVKEAFSHISPS